MRKVLLFVVPLFVLLQMPYAQSVPQSLSPTCTLKPQTVQLSASDPQWEQKIENNQPEEYILGSGTFDLGSGTLQPDDGDKVCGQPMTYTATERGAPDFTSTPTVIQTTGTGGVVAAAGSGRSFTLYNLRLTGSTGCTGPVGRGINGNGNTPTVTARWLRLDSNQQVGAAGLGSASSIGYVEVDNNGDDCAQGEWGGIKISVPDGGGVPVDHAYVHDNNGNGVWWDCDTRSGALTNSYVVNNQKSGVFVEISSFDTSAVLVQHNTVNNNNTDGESYRAGIEVVSSTNVTVEDNIAHGNSNYDIEVRCDSRGCPEPPDPHDGCNSGFPLSNINITDNDVDIAVAGCSLSGVTCSGNTRPARFMSKRTPRAYECNNVPATIIGTSGNDNLYGTGGADVIVGLGGNDYIEGGNGNDTICGNSGDDLLHGNGNGDMDVLYGGNGSDGLWGGNGPDFLAGDCENIVLNCDGGSLSADATYDGPSDHDDYIFNKGAAGGFADASYHCPDSYDDAWETRGSQDTLVYHSGGCGV